MSWLDNINPDGSIKTPRAPVVFHVDSLDQPPEWRERVAHVLRSGTEVRITHNGRTVSCHSAPGDATASRNTVTNMLSELRTFDRVAAMDAKMNTRLRDGVDRVVRSMSLQAQHERDHAGIVGS